jgi:RHS repeat-associated protein
MNRTMGYDGLDRLTTANGPWGFSAYDYDPIDNLVGSSVGSRALVHHFDRDTNRLTALTGSQNLQIAYDPNGNVVQRGTQTYSFDIANRLRTATGRASYLYDGHGRRPWIIRSDGSSRLSAYDLAGKLRFTWDSTKGHTRFVYLGQRLVAEQDDAAAVTYVHTDMLGSPVAKTNAARTVTGRTRYEPYGATVAGSTNPTAIGFTGHVNDADTGLVYMQQRYMDPIIGRFLSVDPVTTDAITGGHFNRYTYADNKPYKYVDPDGRSPVHAGLKVLDLALSSIEIMSAFHTGGAGAGARAIADALLSVPGARAGKAIMKGLDRISDSAREVTLSRKLHGEAAEHAADAIKAGKPDVLVIERAGAAANRQASTGALDKVPGKHLDEYPPAMFKEGGAGASVRAINPRDNMSAGACIGNACRGLPDGARVRIKVGD